MTGRDPPSKIGEGKKKKTTLVSLINGLASLDLFILSWPGLQEIPPAARAWAISVRTPGLSDAGPATFLPGAGVTLRQQAHELLVLLSPALELAGACHIISVSLTLLPDG